MWEWKIKQTKRIIYVTFQQRDGSFSKKQYAYLLEDENNDIIDSEKYIRRPFAALMRVEKEEWLEEVPETVTKKIHRDKWEDISIDPVRFTL